MGTEGAQGAGARVAASRPSPGPAEQEGDEHDSRGGLRGGAGPVRSSRNPLEAETITRLRRRAPAREGICLPQDTARKCRRWDLTPRPGQHTPVLAAGGPAVVPSPWGRPRGRSALEPHGETSGREHPGPPERRPALASSTSLLFCSHLNGGFGTVRTPGRTGAGTLRPNLGCAPNSRED